MGLISFLADLFAPKPVVVDPCLGKCLAVSKLASGDWYWETSEEIRFSRYSILVVFAGGPEGPTDAQSQFWPRIRDRFASFVERAHEKALTNGILEGLSPAEFIPRLVELPERSQAGENWHLVMEHDDTGRSMIAIFQGDTPVKIVLE